MLLNSEQNYKIVKYLISTDIFRLTSTHHRTGVRAPVFRLQIGAIPPLFSHLIPAFIHRDPDAVYSRGHDVRSPPALLKLLPRQAGVRPANSTGRPGEFAVRPAASSPGGFTAAGSVFGEGLHRHVVACVRSADFITVSSVDRYFEENIEEIRWVPCLNYVFIFKRNCKHY